MIPTDWRSHWQQHQTSPSSLKSQPAPCASAIWPTVFGCKQWTWTPWETEVPVLETHHVRRCQPLVFGACSCDVTRNERFMRERFVTWNGIPWQLELCKPGCMHSSGRTVMIVPGCLKKCFNMTWYYASSPVWQVLSLEGLSRTVVDPSIFQNSPSLSSSSHPSPPCLVNACDMFKQTQPLTFRCSEPHDFDDQSPQPSNWRRIGSSSACRNKDWFNSKDQLEGSW